MAERGGRGKVVAAFERYFYLIDQKGGPPKCSGEGGGLGSHPSKRGVFLDGPNCATPKWPHFDTSLVLHSVCAQGFWTGSIYVAHIGGGHTLCVEGLDLLPLGQYANTTKTLIFSKMAN